MRDLISGRYGPGGRMVDVIIASAGGGLRMGGIYKQFLDLEGSPVVYYAIMKFLEYGVNKIVLVVPSDKIEYSREMLSDIDKTIKVIEGGKSRQESVMKGLSECSSNIILIHDGVRPFIKKELIGSIVRGVEEFGVCAPGLPITDTIKLYSGNKILWTVNRRSLLQVQTPQGFKRDILKDIVHLMIQHSVTDELSLVEKLDGDIFWVRGDPINIKITYPEDIKLASIIARSWK